MVRTLSLVAALLLAPAVPVAAQTTIPIDVHRAYLHLDPQDEAGDATAIDLAALGLAPGDLISLVTAGDWQATGSGGDVQKGLLGIFSGSTTVLGRTLLHRIPDAIDAGLDNFSGGTWPSNEPTEVAEDFTIATPAITIVIPPGATTLFVTVADIYYRDNGDPDGDLGVTITYLGTTGVEDGPGAAGIALAATPNPSRSETVISWRQPATAFVRLALYDAGGRRVRELVAGERGAGAQAMRWDGRDSAGRRVAAGSYLARLEGAGFAATARVIRLR